MFNTNQSTVAVRGHRTYQRPATVRTLLAARIADTGFIALIFTILLLATQVSPLPKPWWFAAALALALLYPFLCRATLGRTPGEFFWQLMLTSENPSFQNPLAGRLADFPRRLGASILAAFRPGLIEYAKMDLEVWLVGGTMTFLILVLSAWTSYRAIFSLPLWQPASLIQYEASFPSSTQTEENWRIVPFFYAVGAWPSTFKGRPISYALPYEKGPPHRFAGHIQERWNEMSASVTFEGPRTPRGEMSRARIEECMTSSLLSTSALTCLSLRQAVLDRHIEEMRAKLGNANWDFRWFVVNHPALASEEQARGIYLSASNDEAAQSRFILITPRGVHQTFILNTRRQDPEAPEAQKVFEKAIRSLRVSDDLGQGIAWVDRQIESTDLSKLNSLSDPLQRLQVLKNAQLLLLSKVSVDPKSFESYFHLAGVSFTIAQLAHQQLTQFKIPLEQEARRIWTDSLQNAKILTENAVRYADDVASLDSRMSQLRSLQDQTRKLGSGF